MANRVPTVAPSKAEIVDVPAGAVRIGVDGGAGAGVAELITIVDAGTRVSASASVNDAVSHGRHADVVAGPDSPCRRNAMRAASVGDGGPVTAGRSTAVMTITVPAEVEPNLLVVAAGRVPVLVARAPVLGCDVQTAMLLAASGCAPSAGRDSQLQLATGALDRFVDYLVDTGQVCPTVRRSQALRRWLHGLSPADVQQALIAAAQHYRQRGSCR